MARINTPTAANAVEDALVPPTLEDPYDYAADNQKLYIAKFRALPAFNEIMALGQSRVANKQYQRTYTCLAGLNVGDPVYASASDTVTKADSTSQTNNKVIGFCRYKPTTTTCYLSHFYYVSGLSGGAAGGTCYLTDTGSFSATPGTFNTPVGTFISATEALVYAGPLAGGSGGVVNPGYFGEIDLKTAATTQITIPNGMSINAMKVTIRISTLGGTITGQLTFSLGVSGNNTKLINNKTTTLLTGLGACAVYDQILAGGTDATTTLTFTVNTGMTGSLAIKGKILVEGPTF